MRKFWARYPCVWADVQGQELRSGPRTPEKKTSIWMRTSGQESADIHDPRKVQERLVKDLGIRPPLTGGQNPKIGFGVEKPPFSPTGNGVSSQKKSPFSLWLPA